MKLLSRNITRSLSLSALAVILTAGTADARQLTVEEAIAAATGSAGTTARMRKAASKKLELRHTEMKDGLNTVYVLTSDSDGYMVLSADDVAMPVLGYADEGSFDPDNIPPAMEEWLRQYSDHIAYAATTGARLVSAPRNAAYEDIPEICKTRWNQDSPYNDQCPDINGQKCFTGCVATAMAQVLKAHRWPEQPTGTASWYWSNGATQLSLDMSTVKLDWDNMIDNYGGGAGTTEQRAAVATLMKACGYAAFMGYGTDGSGAVSIQAARGMVDYLGFDKGVRHLPREYFTLAEWTDMLYNELIQGYPLYYDGYGSGGHAFVVDGFSASDGYFHLNWGWGGMSNGFFQIITLDPGKQGIGGSTEGFYDGQSAFFDLRKPIEGSTYAPIILLNGDFQATGSQYGTAPIKFSAGGNRFYSQSIKTINFRMGVRLTDAEGNETYAWATSDDMAGTGGGPTEYSIAREDFPTSGSYVVTPVFRSGNKIHDVYVSRNRGREVNLTCSGTRLKFSNVPYVRKFALSLEASRLYARQTAIVTANITNEGDEYIGLMHARLIDEADNTINFGSQRVGIPAGTTQMLKFSSKLAATVAEGAYKLGIYDKDEKLIGELMDVEVVPAPTGTMAIALSDVKHNFTEGAGTLTNPYKVHPDDIDISASLNCTGGFFIEQVMLRFSPQSSADGAAVDIPSPVLSLEAGESKALRFNDDYSSRLKAGVKYSVTFVYPNSSGKYTKISGSPTLRVLVGEPSGISDVRVDVSESFSLYPNPAVSDVTITGDATLQSADIYSIAGTCMAHHTFAANDGTATIDVTSLAPGHYIVRILTDNGVAVQRLIKR